MQDGEYYDIVLYQTIMGRMYRPEIVDGKSIERRHYMGHYSPLSQEFMRHCLSVYARNRTSANGKVHIVPVYTRAMPGSNFSAELLYVDGVLDMESSRHTKHYRYLSSKADKEKRVEIAKRFANYIMLAQMRMPEYEAEAVLNTLAGAPFGGDGALNRYHDAMYEIFEGYADTDATDKFFEMCQTTFVTMASKRGYNQNNFRMVGRWSSAKDSDPASKLEKPITPDEFRRGILRRINTVMAAAGKSTPVEIPQFVVESEYPRTNISVYG